MFGAQASAVFALTSTPTSFYLLGGWGMDEWEGNGNVSLMGDRKERVGNGSRAYGHHQAGPLQQFLSLNIQVIVITLLTRK